MSSTDPSTPDRVEGTAPATPTFLPPDYTAPGYPAPQAHPAPQAYPQQAYPQQAYPQQAYAPQPTTPQAAYPQQPYAPQPTTPPAQQPYPGTATGWPAAPTAPAERVGRGLLFSLGGIVVGVVLTVVLWKLNFIASITSFAMAYACVWLYVRGASSAPRKGVGALIAVIVAGVVVSLGSIVVADALDYLGQEYPSATLADRIDFILYYVSLPEVWQDYATQALMYLLFAALGTFGLIRQLGRAKGA